MLFAIISAVVCFIAAIIMFFPYYRKVALLRPLAIYLIFQGIWQLISHMVFELSPANNIMMLINYIGTIIIVVYYIFLLLMTSRKSKKKRNKQSRIEE